MATIEKRHYTEIECLPDCEDRDEQGVSHAEDCPRFEAEKNYWASYFGVGTSSFWNFKPADCSCEQGARDNRCPRHGG